MNIVVNSTNFSHFIINKPDEHDDLFIVHKYEDNYLTQKISKDEYFKFMAKWALEIDEIDWIMELLTATTILRNDTNWSLTYDFNPLIPLLNFISPTFESFNSNELPFFHIKSLKFISDYDPVHNRPFESPYYDKFPIFSVNKPKPSIVFNHYEKIYKIEKSCFSIANYETKPDGTKDMDSSFPDCYNNIKTSKYQFQMLYKNLKYIKGAPNNISAKDQLVIDKFINEPYIVEHVKKENLRKYVNSLIHKGFIDFNFINVKYGEYGTFQYIIGTFVDPNELH